MFSAKSYFNICWKNLFTNRLRVIEGKITKQSNFELAGFRVIGVRVIGVKITVNLWGKSKGN